MKFYVAASFGDGETLARPLVECLERRGHEMTCRWWEHVDPSQPAEYCELDIAGVKAADFFVLYNSKKKTPGKNVECGMAIAWKIPIFVVGEEMSGVFRHRTKYLGKFDTPEQTAEAIIVALSQIGVYGV